VLVAAAADQRRRVGRRAGPWPLALWRPHPPVQPALLLPLAARNFAGPKLALDVDFYCEEPHPWRATGQQKEQPQHTRLVQSVAPSWPFLSPPSPPSPLLSWCCLKQGFLWEEATQRSPKPPASPNLRRGLAAGGVDDGEHGEEQPQLHHAALWSPPLLALVRVVVVPGAVRVEREWSAETEALEVTTPHSPPISSSGGGGGSGGSSDGDHWVGRPRTRSARPTRLLPMRVAAASGGVGSGSGHGDGAFPEPAGRNSTRSPPHGAKGIPQRKSVTWDETVLQFTRRAGGSSSYSMASPRPAGSFSSSYTSSVSPVPRIPTGDPPPLWGEWSLAAGEPLTSSPPSKRSWGRTSGRSEGGGAGHNFSADLDSSGVATSEACGEQQRVQRWFEASSDAGDRWFVVDAPGSNRGSRADGEGGDSISGGDGNSKLSGSDPLLASVGHRLRLVVRRGGSHGGDDGDGGRGDALTDVSTTAEAPSRVVVLSLLAPSRLELDEWIWVRMHMPRALHSAKGNRHVCSLYVMFLCFN